MGLNEENKKEDELRRRLQEAEALLDSIRKGEIDALAIHPKGTTRIIPLEADDHTFRIMIEAMNEGALTINKDGTITYCNEGFARTLNLPEYQIIGAPVFRFISAESTVQFTEYFHKAWEKNLAGEIYLQGNKETKTPVKISLTQLHTKEADIIGVIVTDLTSIKAYEELAKAKEQLSIKNEELLRINSDLDTFVYTASHDLKAPVSNLESLFNILLGKIPLNDHLSGIKTMIEASFERFKNTVKDLTEIAKAQKEDSDNVEVVKFSDMVDDVKSGILDQIEKYNAEIQCEFAVPEISFSRKNLRSIIYNFVSNGIKYSAPERRPHIKLSSEQQNGFVVLTIADNGLGIPVENQNKLFQMFKRLHNHVEGTGIGLYIVKRIVDNAGGKIEVESGVGKGSVFKLYFPLATVS